MGAATVAIHRLPELQPISLRKMKYRVAFAPPVDQVMVFWLLPAVPLNVGVDIEKQEVSFWLAASPEAPQAMPCRFRA